MQPVQLSLIPDLHPATPAMLVEQLPVEAVATAIALLAAVIAKAGVPAGMEAATDE
jgi:AMMECR1 domain-containing protein